MHATETRALPSNNGAVAFSSRLTLALLAGHTLCLLVTVPVRTESQQPAVIKAPAAIEAYVDRRFDDAMTAVSRFSEDEMKAMRVWLTTAGDPWIAQVTEDRSHRMLAVAAFVLEAEWVRAERGDYMSGFPAAMIPEKGRNPPCVGACILEWSCSLLKERGAPDEAERVWMLATMAFAGAVRDWSLLVTRLGPPRARSVEEGHALHAIARFPDEPRFRLARAVAHASRYMVLPEMEMPREGERTGTAQPRIPTIVVAPGAPPGTLEERRRTLFEYPRQQFSDLLSDPVIGVEARLRLGYLDMREGGFEQALARERDVLAATKDPDLRYIAAYIGAQAAQALGDLKEAEALYATALEARPHSQSATLGLAALRLLRGDADPAYAMVESSLRERPNDDDPWRLFLYGDFRRLPGLLGQLRAEVAK